MFSRLVIVLLATLVSAASCLAKPTLFVIGDSTVRNSTGGQMGWGDPLVAEFDPGKIEVINRAIGGRSSRTFLTEGRWDAIMAHLKNGDFVLIQFGHNDGGHLNDKRCRASIKGIGGETEAIVRVTDKQEETVRSYGWYLTKYVRDAKAKGAVPIIVSPIPRNIWKDGKIGRSNGDYGHWAKQVAERERAHFIDLNNLLADRFDALGPEKTAEFYAGGDHTHTCAVGAEFNARVVAEAIRSLGGCHLSKGLLPGDLWLPSVFSDHMVLQRDMPLPVWGTTAPGAGLIVRIGGNTSGATADQCGRWHVEMPAMPAGGPHQLEVATKGAVRRVSDVLVGEVWLCSGQSNMDFTLAPTPKRSFSGVTDWKKEVAAADHPELRMFTAEWTMREFPQR
jgi:lysophospholipase L1-like esterase